VGGGEQHAAAGLVEVAAGRAALAVRDAPAGIGGRRPAADVEHELLIARHAVAAMLIDQLAAVGAPVRFGVLAAERQLAQVAKMDFLGMQQRNRRRG
jgi:hypothetical protein